MHFWNRELINHSHPQNDHQRYQFALAALRLGKTELSRRAITEGSSAFQDQLKTRLLLIELALKEKKFEQAEQMLLLIRKLCTPAHTLQWQQLMDRCQPESAKIQITDQPKNLTEWQRTLSLTPHHPDAIIDFYKWASQQNTISTRDSLNGIDSFAKFSSYQLYQIFNALKENPEHWETLIESILSVATQKNKEPEKMWLNWIKLCPDHHKKHLLHKMESILVKYPNWKLEDILRLHRNNQMS